MKSRGKMLNGIPVKLNKKLGYRMGNPEIDKDLHGNTVERNYVVIVKISDCRIYEKDGKNYYDPSEAPGIPMAYGGTYYGYGEQKLRKSDIGVWIGAKLCNEYYQWNVYFVEDGRVYVASRRGTVDSIREHARYEEGTDTIRKIPENYCLIAWKLDGEPDFAVDGATKSYRDIVIEAYEFWKTNNINNKEVLATIVNNKFKQLS